MQPTVSIFRRYGADLALLTTAILWGVNIPVVKSAIGEMDPLAFNGMRMVLSTIVLGLLSLAESKRQPKTKRGSWSLRRGALFIILNGVCYPFAFIFGINYTTAGNSAILLATMPAWTAMIAFHFTSERLSRLTWIGIAISLAGTLSVVVAGSDVSFSSTYLVGNLLMLAASIGWSASTVVSGPLLQTISPLKLAFWSSLFATPIQLLATLPEIPGAVQQLQSPQLVAALVYSGVMSTGIAYATWHYGVRQLGGSHASVYQNLVTLVAVSTSWVFLKEPILLWQIFGGVILFVGLYLMRRSRSAVDRNAKRKQSVAVQES